MGCVHDEILVEVFEFPGPGNAPQYYKLTLESFRLVVADPAALPPSKRHFHELGIPLHDHTRTLAAINVHTLVSAQRHHVAVSDFHRENMLSFTAAGATIKFDACFTLASPSGKTHAYRVELDNGTEPIVRKREGESIDRKLRAYDEDVIAHHDAIGVAIGADSHGCGRVRDVHNVAAEEAWFPCTATLPTIQSLCRPTLLGPRGSEISAIHRVTASSLPA